VRTCVFVCVFDVYQHKLQHDSLSLSIGRTSHRLPSHKPNPHRMLNIRLIIQLAFTSLAEPVHTITVKLKLISFEETDCLNSFKFKLILITFSKTIIFIEIQLNFTLHLILYS